MLDFFCFDFLSVISFLVVREKVWTEERDSRGDEKGEAVRVVNLWTVSYSDLGFLKPSCLVTARI